MGLDVLMLRTQPGFRPPRCSFGGWGAIRRVMPYLACLCGLTLFPLPVHADIAVVVSHNSPIVSLSKAQVADLYLGRTRVFPNGDLAQVFDHPHRTALRERFFLTLTGLSLQHVDAYWARLTFSGRVLPPRSLPHEEALLEVVRKNAHAIGYVHRGALPETVRTVLILKE